MNVIIERGNLDEFKIYLHTLPENMWHKAMRMAIIYGHLHIVQYLTEQGVQLNLGMVEYACRHDMIHILDYMAKHINISDIQIVKYVIKNGLLNILKYLQDKYPDVWINDSMYLECAIYHGNIQIFTNMYQSMNKENFDHVEFLICAVQNGNLPILTLLIQGYNYDKRDLYEALHEATLFGYQKDEIIHYLAGVVYIH